MTDVDWVARARRIALERAGDGILRHLPDGRAVADRRILAHAFDVSEWVIRTKLIRACVDEETGRALYDVKAAAPILDQAQGRPGGRIPRHVRACQTRTA
jgi:hypothetical protein